MKKWIHAALILSSIILPNLLWAESGHGNTEHGGHEGIPWPTIVSQAVNFGLLLILLAYLTRQSITKMFSERKKMYLELVQKADEAKFEAESNRQQIADRLQKLEGSAQQSLEQAKAEAAEMQQRLISEAQELASKAREEAERAARFELERAKQELRAEILTTALEAAQKAMRDKVGSPEQKKLQNEFVEKFQVVR